MERAEGGGGEAFAQGGDDAAGDENILHGKVVGRAVERVKKIRPAGPVTESRSGLSDCTAKKNVGKRFFRSGRGSPAPGWGPPGGGQSPPYEGFSQLGGVPLIPPLKPASGVGSGGTAYLMPFASRPAPPCPQAPAVPAVVPLPSGRRS